MPVSGRSAQVLKTAAPHHRFLGPENGQVSLSGGQGGGGCLWRRRLPSRYGRRSGRESSTPCVFCANNAVGKDLQGRTDHREAAAEVIVPINLDAVKVLKLEEVQLN
jgi:hypothetical protein